MLRYRGAFLFSKRRTDHTKFSRALFSENGIISNVPTLTGHAVTPCG